MALDGIVVRAITSELQAIVGGKINKIHQPTNQDIIFQIRAQGTNVKLLLSANPTYPRVHATNLSYQNPLEAPMFCMLLRKNCENGTIEAVSQVDSERIIHIDVRHMDELGDIGLRRIVIELMGRHSNIILLNPATGVILDGIHHVTPTISSYRIVMPGAVYVPPPDQGKHNPLHATKGQIAQSLVSESDTLVSPQAASQALVKHFSGISPQTAKEIVYRSNVFADSTYSREAGLTADRMAETFMQVMNDVRSGAFIPNIVETANGKTVYSVIALNHVQGERVAFESVSECLESFYGDKAEKDTVKQRVADLIRFLQNEAAKNEKKLDKLADTLTEAKDADRFRIRGELLTASLHLINKGDAYVDVTDYYDEEQKLVRIELDPLLGPSENAQKLFKKYNKSKNSLIAVQEQIDNAKQEIRYLHSLLQQLDDATLADVDEIREELIEQRYLRDRSKKQPKKKKSGRPVLHCFMSSEQIPIYVGKNNTQNDYLTLRFADSNDTWLHTKDIPGSHVVIKSASFGDSTLAEAAQLAAYFSQAKLSSQVPVDHTLVRHVRKPSGAKPGYVIYDKQKTLYVTPDEQRIKAMPLTVR